MEPIKHYYESGEIKIEQWYIDGNLHKVDGPALILYYKSGEILLKEWWINGKLHRVGGAATMHYYKDGEINEEHWYIDGVKMISEVRDWCKENNIHIPFIDEDAMAFKLRWS